MVSRCGATSARSALAVPLELSDLPGISDHLLVPGKRNDLDGVGQSQQTCVQNTAQDYFYQEI
jgi:hypothetical protein